MITFLPRTIDLLEASIAKYGKPEQILTDHGTQFYANKKNGLGVSTFNLLRKME